MTLPRLAGCANLPPVRAWKLSVWLLGIVPAALAGDGDWLRFRNGDGLHGALLRAETATGLQFRSQEALQPATFEWTNLAEVHLAPRPPQTARNLHRFIVQLTNGDRLAGDLAGLDETTLTLNTWYAGPLKLKRTMVKQLEARDAVAEAIYTGPTGANDWQSIDNRNAWTFRKGALYSQPNQYGTVGRDVGLTDMSSLEFDVAWRGQVYWNIGLGYSNLRNPNMGGYMLSCSGNSFNLMRMSAGNSRSIGGGQTLNDRTPRTKMHLTIRIHRPKKQILVYLDKVLVKQWTDTDDFAGKGGGVTFQSQGQGQIRISNISVTSWDGKLDDDSGATASSAEDLLRVTNGDKVSGNLRALAGNELALSTSFAEVKIPLERVSTILFAGKAAETPRRQTADITALFADSSRFTVTLEKLDDKGLTGNTEVCGRVTLPIDTFTRLRFNVYTPVALEDDDDWPKSTTDNN